MFNKLFLLILLLLPTVGCTQMVGGACSYETLYGTARIVELQGDKTYAQFNPGQQSFSDIRAPFNQQMKFSLPTSFAGKIGTIYPAQLAVITKGSCTPYRLAMLASENFSQGFFIPFGREGNIAEEEKLTLKQIATIFKKLSPAWPQLVLNICGQTHRQGTDEYNLSLGERHARMASQQLQQEGISDPQIETKSMGEQPCSNSTIFADEVKNGIWLNFLLTGKDLQLISTPTGELNLTELVSKAKQGDAKSQLALGLYYADATGAEQNYDLGFHWVRKAAEQNLPAAQFELAKFYITGSGTEKSIEQSMIWLNKAAEQGLAEAQIALGKQYTSRKKNIQNYTAAHLWLNKAAAQNSAEAMELLALMSVRGQGIEQSYHQAAQWLRQAVDNGSLDAAYNLAYFYIDGTGVEQSTDTGESLFKQAAIQGHSFSINYFITKAQQNSPKAKQFMTGLCAEELYQSDELKTYCNETNK